MASFKANFVADLILHLLYSASRREFIRFILRILPSSASTLDGMSHKLGWKSRMRVVLRDTVCSSMQDGVARW